MTKVDLWALAMIELIALTATAQDPPSVQATSQPVQAHAAQASSAPAAQTASSASFDPIKARGAVTEHLACANDPTQSYALYLPSKYSSDRGWPIVYAFDPFAHGKAAVELYKDAAEKYGYIVAGSNNAKNGPATLEVAAAQAMWEDTHNRFAIDKNRVYTTGLSGGARFATSFALYCYTCAVAGVIAHGAGYPVKEGRPVNEHFVYYVAVGDVDFNLPELLALRKKKEAEGAQFKVKIYPGPHQWAPKEVVEDAVAWLQLKAMQAGTEKLDPAFVHGLLERTRAEADQAGQRGDAMTQFYALRSMAVDFKGLADVSQFAAQLAALKTSKAFKKAEQAEQLETEKQEKLTGIAAAQIAQLGQVSSEDRSTLEQQLVAAFSDLRRYAASNAGDHKVYTRALNQLWIQGIEAGQDELRSNHLIQAAAYFELMATVAPDQPWPVLLLAETRVREGNRKAALKELQVAVRRGLKRPESLTDDPDLAPLRQDPEFQKIVSGLKQSP